MIQWNSPSVQIRYNRSTLDLKIYLTPNELLKIIYESFDNDQLAILIGELLSNCDLSVKEKNNGSTR